ncbi:MAG: hypothetical protein GY783_09840, partial [Gammaproteobacteria bacterium]|nr:hypothetical protein [Gammaproteobacteria bacterium]
AWEKLAVRGTLSDSATGFAIRYGFASAAEDEEYFYVDDLESRRSASLTLAREDNLIDRASCESTTAPGILGETGSIVNGTWARSNEQKDSGNYSFKITKTSAIGGGSVFAYFTDNATSSDLHGIVPGESLEASIRVYVPSTGGPAVGEARLQIAYYDSASWTETVVAATVQDAFETLSVSITLPTTATGFWMRAYIQSDATPAESIYVDSVRVKRHSVPGTHKLTGGHTEHLVTLPDTGTIQIKFKPNFAYNVASDQHAMVWRAGATQYFVIYYPPASAMFRVLWFDGGTARSLSSAQYDDGTTYRNINQWQTLTIAFDLTTGTTAGSSLWMNKTQDDTAWSGAIDAKTTTFNAVQIRAWTSTPKDYDIAYIRMFPDYVATDADVQNDFKTVTAEEILWSFDGHATARTRVNISRFYSKNMSLTRSARTLLAGSYGANKFNATLLNLGGEFSDDQYGTYDPTADSFNGTAAQAYLRKRFGIIHEDWYGGDFDYVFVGRIVRGGLRRDSSRKDISYAALSAADTAADLGTKPITKGHLFEDSKLADVIESNSILHQIARLGRPLFKQYLAGNSWEIDGDKADQWTASGGTYTTQTNPMFGARCGRLVPGAGAETLYAWVTFDDTEKLTVGQTFTFSVYVLSTAAATGASNFIQLHEYDASGTNGNTEQTYTLAGGEGFTKVSVTRTITDDDSDELRVFVGGAAGDTIDIDGASLIPGDRALDLFRESSYVLNQAAASGAVSADYHDEIAWDEFGFDVQLVDYQHPWPTVADGSTVWDNLKPLFDAMLVDYGGFNEAGTLSARGYLESSREEPLSAHLFTESTIRNKLSTSINPVSGNKIIGHGLKIMKHGRTVYRPSGNQLLVVAQRVLWQGSATDAFTESLEGLILNVSIADDDYFPDREEFPVYWAHLGDTEDKVSMFRDLWARWKAGDLPSDMRSEISGFNKQHGPLTGLAPQVQYFGSGGAGFHTGGLDIMIDSPDWQPNGPAMELVGGEKLVGVKGARLLHKLSDTGADGNSALTEESLKNLVSGLDVISRPGFARVLLRNETGSEVFLIDAGVVGRPVTVYSDDSGYINDFHSLPEDIALRGEKKIEFGNKFILGDVRAANTATNPTHLDVLCDYWKEYSFTRRHTHTFPMSGSRFYISPGQWSVLDVGDAGDSEYINSTNAISAVTISRTPSGIGKTMISLAEVKQGYVSSAARDLAAFFSSGKKPRTHRTHVTVASQYHIGEADFRCTGTNDEATINAAISFMSGAYGGGEVRLTEGTFNLLTKITALSKVALVGQGAQSILTMVSGFSDADGIRGDGASGSELTGITLKDFTITCAATTRTNHIYFDYVDDSRIENVTTDATVAPPDQSMYLDTCDRVTVLNCTIKEFELYGVIASAASSTFQNLDISTTNSGIGQFGLTTSGADNYIADIRVHGLTSTTGDAVGLQITGNRGRVYGIDVSDLTAGGSGATRGVEINATYGVIDGILVHDITQAGTGIFYGASLNAKYGSASNVTVESIDCSDSATVAYCLSFGTGASSGAFSNLVVRAITKDGSGALYGAYCNGVDDITITGLAISSLADTDGASTGDIRGVAATNAAMRNSIAGFSIETITAAGSGDASGVLLPTGNDGWTIGPGTITGCTNHGIDIASDGNTITNTTVVSCDVGIEIKATGDAHVVVGNSASGNPTNQFVDGGTNTVEL